MTSRWMVRAFVGIVLLPLGCSGSDDGGDGGQNGSGGAPGSGGDGQWGDPVLIETEAGDALLPQVALDPSGNAVAVWRQSDGMRFNIWANRFTPAAGWGAAELIETDDAGDAAWPRVALDPNGNAVAVWSQSDGTRDSIWANRFTPAAGWGAAELIETEGRR